MKTRYIDLIEQTFDFPQEEFSMSKGELLFHDFNLMDLIKQYGTPLKFFYLPKISEKIKEAKKAFNVAIAKSEYKGAYNFCYCTKSSHFSFVLQEALKNDIHIETSSAFDINIIESLAESNLVNNNTYIICNGYKMPTYIENIQRLILSGYKNVMPIIDNPGELDWLCSIKSNKVKVGIRIASEEEPKFEFYTSRLGIRYSDIIPLYQERIATNKNLQFKMLHFFVNTGITDTAYYWNELTKCLNVYCQLKKICPELDSLNIGGGFPIKTSLNFDYNYQYMAEEIIAHIKHICGENNVPEPNIFSEFGKYTVGESGGAIFSVIDQKKQNDKEKWNMIDSSFMTSLPDTWAINQRYIMLPVNKWNEEYERVFLGGLTCDSDDYYNSEQHTNAIYLPKFKKGEKLYLAFFYTGAYQEAIGGFGGIQHCLTPAPKIVLIDRDEETNEIHTKLFSKEQSYKSMLKVLGYF